MPPRVVSARLVAVPIKFYQFHPIIAKGSQRTPKVALFDFEAFQAALGTTIVAGILPPSSASS